MYLKKVDGPRAVTLPDGSILTRADLPPAETRRWVASRKARVVKAVAYGLLSLKEALERYALSEEEFELWRDALWQFDGLLFFLARINGVERVGCIANDMLGRGRYFLSQGKRRRE